MTAHFEAHETCSCGASINLSGNSVHVEYRLREFREAHTVCREKREDHA